eukprot:scaffold64050_cov37-Cyclotella_meneghiniana.AAC.8
MLEQARARSFALRQPTASDLGPSDLFAKMNYHCRLHHSSPFKDIGVLRQRDNNHGRSEAHLIALVVLLSR